MSFVTDLMSNSANLSFGRFMSLLTTMFVLGWDTGALVFAWHFNHHLAPGVNFVDLLPSAGTLLAQGGFCTLFYGVTKYGDLNGGTKS